jgi:hypothetical protein
MPAIDDFPAVGQREYHAKKSPAPGKETPAAERPVGRKLGFFERLTGRVRNRSGDSPEAPSQRANNPQASGPNPQWIPQAQNAAAPGAAQNSRQLSVGTGEDNDFPAFFDRKRRC